MSHFDRHIAINAGWFAGPAVGLILMASPIYIGVERAVAGVFFWIGIAVFFCSVLAGALAWARDKGRLQTVMGPGIVIGLGIVLICAGSAWYFWPIKAPVADAAVATASVAQEAAPRITTSPDAPPKPKTKARVPRHADPSIGYRAEIMRKLRIKYIADHDGITSGMLAGIDDLPVDWTNQQLELMGEPWRVSSNAPRKPKAPSIGGNAMGDVIGNAGIVTQGQKGNNEKN